VNSPGLLARGSLDEPDLSDDTHKVPTILPPRTKGRPDEQNGHNFDIDTASMENPFLWASFWDQQSTAGWFGTRLGYTTQFAWPLEDVGQRLNGSWSR